MKGETLKFSLASEARTREELTCASQEQSFAESVLKQLVEAEYKIQGVRDTCCEDFNAAERIVALIQQREEAKIIELERATKEFKRTLEVERIHLGMKEEELKKNLEGYISVQTQAQARVTSRVTKENRYREELIFAKEQEEHLRNALMEFSEKESDLIQIINESYALESSLRSDLSAKSEQESQVIQVLVQETHKLQEISVAQYQRAEQQERSALSEMELIMSSLVQARKAVELQQLLEQTSHDERNHAFFSEEHCISALKLVVEEENQQELTLREAILSEEAKRYDLKEVEKKMDLFEKELERCIDNEHALGERMNEFERNEEMMHKQRRQFEESKMIFEAQLEILENERFNEALLQKDLDALIEQEAVAKDLLERAVLHCAEEGDKLEHLLIEEVEKEESLVSIEDSLQALQETESRIERESRLFTFTDGSSRTYNSLLEDFRRSIQYGRIEDFYTKAETNEDFRGHVQAIEHKTNELVSLDELSKEEWKEEEESYLLEWMLRENSSFLALLTVIETEDKVFIVRKYAEYSLFEIIEDKNFDEDEAKHIVTQVLEALRTLRGLGIAHRNIKPDSFAAEVGDSGVTVKMSNFRSASAFDRCHTAGTLSFIAPEILSRKVYSEQGAKMLHYLLTCLTVDMWSLGVLTFSLLMGYNPFDEDEDEATKENISNCKINLESDWNISADAQDFILKCLRVDPQLRLTPAAAFLHPWIIPPAAPKDLSEVSPATPLAVVSKPQHNTETQNRMPGWRSRRLSHSQLTPEEQQRAFRDWIQITPLQENYTLTNERSNCFKHFFKGFDKRTSSEVAISTLTMEVLPILIIANFIQDWNEEKHAHFVEWLVQPHPAIHPLIAIHQEESQVANHN